MGSGRKLLKPNRGINIVTQQGFSNVYLIIQKAFSSFSKQPNSKLSVIS